MVRESDSGRREALDLLSELELLAMWTLVRGGKMNTILMMHAEPKVSRHSLLCNQGLPLELASCEYLPGCVGVGGTALELCGC